MMASSSNRSPVPRGRGAMPKVVAEIVANQLADADSEQEVVRQLGFATQALRNNGFAQELRLFFVELTVALEELLNSETSLYRSSNLQRARDFVDQLTADTRQDIGSSEPG
jgi:hypothetical protein